MFFVFFFSFRNLFTTWSFFSSGPYIFHQFPDGKSVKNRLFEGLRSWFWFFFYSSVGGLGFCVDGFLLVGWL